MDEPRMSMGVGRLAAPTTQFVQKFRWTLESEGLDQLLLSSAKVHFHAKLIDFECYELIELGTNKGIEAQDWAQDWSEESISKKTLTLTTYDGCGSPIYRYVFKDLKIVGESVEFDYAKSGPLMRRFQVKYKKYDRKVFQEGRSINPKEDADEGRKSRNRPGSEEVSRKAL